MKLKTINKPKLFKIYLCSYLWQEEILRGEIKEKIKSAKRKNILIKKAEGGEVRVRILFEK